MSVWCVSVCCVSVCCVSVWCVWHVIGCVSVWYVLCVVGCVCGMGWECKGRGHCQCAGRRTGARARAGAGAGAGALAGWQVPLLKLQESSWRDHRLLPSPLPPHGPARRPSGAPCCASRSLPPASSPISTQARPVPSAHSRTTARLHCLPGPQSMLTPWKGGGGQPVGGWRQKEAPLTQ